MKLLPVRSLPEKGADAARAFGRHYGAGPAWLVAAPGRINVIGEHVDYCEGLVLPMAIDRHVLMAAGPVDEPRIKIYSTLTKEEAIIQLDEPVERGFPAWSNYMRGVVRGFLEKGFEVGGLDILVESDLPMGGGLSSSAALEVATATLLETVTGRRLKFSSKALLCQKAEQAFAGVPCGIMDQFASVYGRAGHLLLIDCRSQKVHPVEMRDPTVTFLVIDTKVKHELGSSEYPVRRLQCEDAAKRLGLSTLRDAALGQMESAAGSWPEPVRRRARHVIGEISRTLDLAEAVRQGHWERAGELMYASHASLREDFEVSCEELDLVVKLSGSLGRAHGVYGCRMTGGGFGGCCVALVKTPKAEQIARHIGQAYADQTGIIPGMFVSEPADGTARLEMSTAS